MSFRNMSATTIQSFLQGKDLVLRTVISHRTAKNFPTEVAWLMSQYDMALKDFNQRVKSPAKTENLEDISGDKKPIMHKIMKDEEEGRYK